ncbi:NIP7 N-terminal domain-related protein [Pyrococcus sp. NA2]|uniref:NIP7 pre-PUA domain-containing protein n=1 Tax=Pyrococcus sp. (strain NA2) TaxID=342949 RepID=UPI00064F7C11|nr:NIP7 N-terminal domain-related protein [Pyrococcus sp. NA2]
MNGELRIRRVSSWELDLILREAEKYGDLSHEFFCIVEGKYRDVYAVNEEIWKIIERLKLRPYSLGTFVGTIKIDENLVEKFHPNIEFFGLLSLKKNYAILGPKASFLFTTGKDVPRRAVIKLNWRGSKRIVVLNELGDIIGLGLVNPDDEEKFIKNLRDVGEILRR